METVEEKKKVRKNLRETFLLLKSLVEEGKTFEEIPEVVGLKATTINLYLRGSKYKAQRLEFFGSEEKIEEQTKIKESIEAQLVKVLGIYQELTGKTVLDVKRDILEKYSNECKKILENKIRYIESL